MDVMRLLMYLAIGTVAMLVPVMIQGAWYQVKWSKRVLAAILLTVAGTLGTFLMYFIENQRFGGISFFGAVFFVPVLFIPVARLLGIRYDLLMDLCAPAECVMLAIMKVQCYLTNCCVGVRIISGGKEYVFPSQIAELFNGLIICVILLCMSRKYKNRGRIFPMYMVIYGVTRFILNLFRQGGTARILGLPLGNFWSLVSIAIGVVWLIWVGKKTVKEATQ